MAVFPLRFSSQRYTGLKDWISQYVRKDDNILMVGCGNSRLSEDMFDDGFASLTNIDVSRVVIDQMAARCRYGTVLVYTMHQRQRGVFQIYSSLVSRESSGGGTYTAA